MPNFMIQVALILHMRRQGLEFLSSRWPLLADSVDYWAASEISRLETIDFKEQLAQAEILGRLKELPGFRRSLLAVQALGQRVQQGLASGSISFRTAPTLVEMMRNFALH